MSSAVLVYDDPVDGKPCYSRDALWVPLRQTGDEIDLAGNLIDIDLGTVTIAKDKPAPRIEQGPASFTPYQVKRGRHWQRSKTKWT